MLDRALDQSTGGGQSELFHRLIDDQVVPDEARIINALSDVSVSPLVTVRDRAPPGRSSSPTPRWLARPPTSRYRRWNRHLRVASALAGPGRARTGHASMKQDYEIVTAETYVL